MSVPSPIAIAHRVTHRQQEQKLAETFNQYNQTVQKMRDLGRSKQNKVHEAEVDALCKNLNDVTEIYTMELESVKGQLDDAISERNTYHLNFTKYSALYTEVNEKYNDEKSTRCKLENALADAHRLCSEKDAISADLRVSIGQVEHAHIDTQKERDEFLSELTNIRVRCDNETKMRCDLQGANDKLADQIEFERRCHEQDKIEWQNRCKAGEETIRIADIKLKDQDIVADNLQKQVAAIKHQTQSDFVKYQETCENSYESQYQQHKDQMDKINEALTQANEEVIQLKACIEEMNTKIRKMDSKCASYHEENATLIRTLEKERYDHAHMSDELNKRLRDVGERYNTKCRELNVANNAMIPYHEELEQVACVISAETKKLDSMMSNPNVNFNENQYGNGFFSNRSKHAMSANGESPRRHSLSRRQKSPAATLEQQNKDTLPPLKTGYSSFNGGLSARAPYEN